MDAVLATIVAGGRAQFQKIIEVNRNKLISTLIYGIYSIALTVALEKICLRHGFIKSMPLEGRAAPPPRWCCLSCCLRFLCVFWLVTCQSDVSYLSFRGVTKWATQACTIPYTMQRYKNPAWGRGCQWRHLMMHLGSFSWHERWMSIRDCCRKFDRHSTWRNYVKRQKWAPSPIPLGENFSWIDFPFNILEKSQQRVSWTHSRTEFHAAEFEQPEAGCHCKPPIQFENPDMHHCL